MSFFKATRITYDMAWAQMVQPYNIHLVHRLLKIKGFFPLDDSLKKKFFSKNRIIELISVTIITLKANTIQTQWFRIFSPTPIELIYHVLPEANCQGLLTHRHSETIGWSQPTLSPHT